MLRACLSGSLLSSLLCTVTASGALAEDAGGGGIGGWFSGDWYLKVGAAGFTAPKFDGERGSSNQHTLGVSATYEFDFQL